jgi:hypothetical protein
VLPLVIAKTSRSYVFCNQARLSHALHFSYDREVFAISILK